MPAIVAGEFVVRFGRRLGALLISLMIVSVLKLFHRIAWRVGFVGSYFISRVFIPFFFVSSNSVLVIARAVMDAVGVKSLCEIGSGSGYISIELAKAHRNGYFVAVDLAHEAVYATKLNSKLHEVFDRVDVVQCYLGGCLRAGSFDACASNPPYLPCPQTLSRDLCGGVDEDVYRGVVLDLVRVSRRLSIVSASSLTLHKGFMDSNRSRFIGVLTRSAGLDKVSVYIVRPQS